jgi:putative transposase
MRIRATTIVDIREQIAVMALSGVYGVTEIADRFDVSRPTVYRYRDRYRERGREGLVDRSRAPHTKRTTEESVRRRIIEERQRFGFGAKKIRRRMLDEDRAGKWPARSTIEAILQREGLVHRRPRRPRYHSPFRQRFSPSGPGELQAIDFKGEWRLGNGEWCHPLTMTDSHSRYLLACRALPSIRLQLVWPIVEQVFREHGLPQAVLSDNGPPFGAHGLGRFSLFSVRLMELGIQPVFIRPGHPEENGRHERMHRALLESPLFRAASGFAAQQKMLDSFRSMYNEERPHEGIDMDRPARRHQPSPRPYPSTIPAAEYPSHFQVRRVAGNGAFKWRSAYVSLSKAFTGHTIGLTLVEDQLWDVYYRTFLIGRFDEAERRFL